MIASKELPYKMAAYLIAESKKNGIESVILDRGVNETLDRVIEGAKKAEQYLDIPLKDRPREPFKDSIPNHLDKPLRSLLGFIDDGLPEYSAFKFWEERKNMGLSQKIDNITTMAQHAGNPPIPVDLNAAMGLHQIIKDYPQLDQRIPGHLQEMRRMPPQVLDKLFSKDAEAVMKSELPFVQWHRADKLVLDNLMGILNQIKGGIPQGLRPEVVVPIAAEIRNVSYELMGRQMYGTKASSNPIPVDPDKIAVTIMASEVLGQGMNKLASDFPSFFSVLAGLSVPPKSTLTVLQTFFSKFGKVPSPLEFLKVMNTGRVNLIQVNSINDKLFEDGSKDAGAHPETMGMLKDSSDSASKRPLLSAITVKSEELVRKEFDSKKKEVRAKIGQEVQKALQPKPEQQVEPTQEYPEIQDEDLAMMDTEELSPMAPEQHQVESTASGPKEAEKASPGLKAEAQQGRLKPIHDFLAKNKLSWKDLKKKGLAQDFKHLKDAGIIA